MDFLKYSSNQFNELNSARTSYWGTKFMLGLANKEPAEYSKSFWMGEMNRARANLRKVANKVRLGLATRRSSDQEVYLDLKRFRAILPSNFGISSSTERLSVKARKTSCDCLSYNKPENHQKTQSVLLDPMEYFKYDSIAKTVEVDACIADDIRKLWSAGIETGGCCCGHNKRRKSVVLTNYQDAGRARSILGHKWEILAWKLIEVGVA